MGLYKAGGFRFDANEAYKEFLLSGFSYNGISTKEPNDYFVKRTIRDKT